MKKIATLAAAAALAVTGAAAGIAVAKKEAPAQRYFVAELPAEVGAGKPREFKGAADTPWVKTVTIALRKGTVLAEHSTPSPVIIQSLSGSGKMRMGDKVEALSPERMVILEPNVAHEITPEPGTGMLLLVHHLKGGEPGQPAHAHGSEQGSR